MKQLKKSVSAWVWVVLITAFAAFVGFFVWLYYGQMVNEAATPVSTLATSTTSTPLTYSNKDYSFTLALPADWKGYQVKKDTTEVGTTAIYRIGVPLKDQTYYNAVSIFVYTLSQWQAVDKTVPSAGILKQNSQYVFAFRGDSGAPSENPSDYAGISKLDLRGQSEVANTFQFTR